MPSEHSVERHLPEELRGQLAVQLQIDNSYLAAIPTDGLYRLREQLNFDELTGVLTRRAGMAALEEAIARVRLAGVPSSPWPFWTSTRSRPSTTRGAMPAATSCSWPSPTWSGSPFARRTASFVTAAVSSCAPSHSPTCTRPARSCARPRAPPTERAGAPSPPAL